MQKRNSIGTNGRGDLWVNPEGSYGDILMLSGVLKQCYDIHPDRQYCLVRKAVYSNLLDGHPAIKEEGYPPQDATVIPGGYWRIERPGPANKRPYQIMARFFGLSAPVEELLYVPGFPEDDAILHDFIPSEGKMLVVIAPASRYPRKMMNVNIWQEIVEGLKHKSMFVVQAGLKDEPYIPGAYSLLGLTSPRQLIALLHKSDLVITVDNFIMHAAHLTEKPAIVIWGPTQHEVFGYSGHLHLQGKTDHCGFIQQCLSHESPESLYSPCPLHEMHCLNGISADTIIKQATYLCNTGKSQKGK
jgi:hypothetical protein